MNGADRLEQALRALREADVDRGAPIAARTRLQAAFREHHSNARRRSWWRWTAVGVCAAASFIAVWRFSLPATVNYPGPVAVVVHPAPLAAPEMVPATVDAPKRKVAKRPRSAVAAAPQHSAPGPGVEEFIKLPYAPPFSASDYGQVMRVRLPRQSLRSMGLPVNEDRFFDRVPADLLLGEDGVPRAIRLATYR